MDKIQLIYNIPAYQSDIYSLIKAFYPGARVEQVEEGNKDNKIYRLWLEKDKVTCGYKDEKVNLFEELVLEIEDTPLDIKSKMKKVLYKILEKTSQKELPWGTLTGIRPLHLIDKTLQEVGVENTHTLQERYLISSSKLQKGLSILDEEKKLLDKVSYKTGYSLYVGIPYCPSLCLYCSFGSSIMAGREKEKKDYVEALCKELIATSKMMKDHCLQTIYIGGGTPISLTLEELDKLLATIYEYFDQSGVYEYTLEAGRPDLFTEEKLALMKKYGVNRISINPQTMNDETLIRIGRNHTSQDVIEAYYMAKEEGFDNINMDIILGLPGEGIRELTNTFEKLNPLKFDSLTVHSLALKRGSRLYEQLEKYPILDWHNSSYMMQMTDDWASIHGMKPYYLYRQKNIAGNFENTGYAKFNKACYYNIFIMEEKQSIIACGAKASSRMLTKEGILREANLKDPALYIERIDEMIDKKKIYLYKGGYL